MNTSDHLLCGETIREKARIAGEREGFEFEVSEFPFSVSYAAYPAIVAACPHGCRYWIQPSAAGAVTLGLGGGS